MKKLALLVSLFAVFLNAQNEFTINQLRDSTQREPVVAKLSTGGYVVAFTSTTSANAKDVKLRFFNANDIPAGAEIAITALPSNQEGPAIAVDNNDRTAIVFASYNDTSSVFDIYLKMYNAAGSIILNQTIVNTTTRYTQFNPSVAFAPSGNFAVVWDSWFQDGGDRGVYCQMFNADGTKQGTEFLVNQVTAYSQARPKIKFFSDGTFIIVWESFKQDILAPSGYGMYARIFRQNGTALTSETRINSTTTDYQWLGDVEVLDNDQAIIAWTSWEQDGDDGGIFVQRFTKTGSKSGNETQINKTTAFYQWLPKIKKMPNAGAAVIWSSWKQDGNREGVFCTFIDSLNRRTVFETRVNTTAPSFQWEPDCIVSAPNEILAVWSSYGQNNSEYDIIARRVRPDKPQAEIPFSRIMHTAGTSTSELIIHAIDSSLFNGNNFKVTFDTTTRIDSAYMSITNTTTNTVAVNRYPVDRGLNQFYITPAFNGAAVEIRPVFALSLDAQKSFFRKSSLTNLNFILQPPSAGTRLTAPVDIALVWGNTDTAANGTYLTPSDTAIGITGQRTIIVPFKAWNAQTGAKVNLLVKEPVSGRNNKWNPGEEIVFLTPPPFQITGFNTHAQLATQFPASPIVMPQPGDTFYSYTTRALTPADVFQFTLSKSALVDINTLHTPDDFILSNNYPNPFNPATTFKFTLPSFGLVSLKIYDVLGKEISVLINESRTAGTYKITWNATGNSTGVYFAVLSFQGKSIVQKLSLIK